jgi:uncharacterized membrane protein YphA (DoxX/SURF4 family)
MIGITLLIGRILFGGFFLYNAWKHFSGARGMAAYAATKGVPAPLLAILGSGALLLVGGLSVLLDFRPALFGWTLVLFLVGVTPVMHSFWKEEGQARAMQKIQFSKNTALLGAVLMMIALYR